MFREMSKFDRRAHALRVLGVALVIGGCAGTDGTPQAPLAAPVTADDLRGAWVFGSSSEPAPGAVSTCGPDQTMTITADGAVVSACTSSCRTLETLTGQNQAGHLQLTGSYQGNLEKQPTAVSYDLRYDAATQHLVGTRDGQPFWAAPLIEPSGCAASPSP